MTSRSAQDLLRQMRRVVVPVPDSEAEQARRERIAARLLELTAELHVQRKRRQRLSVLLAAIVSMGVVVLGFRFAPSFVPPGASSVRIVSGHIAVRDAAGSRAWTETTLDLEGEPVVQTGATEAVSLELPSTAAVLVSASSELALVRNAAQGGWSERIQLRTGGVALRVPKLANNQRLSVETADALVEVRGTRFAVHVEHDARGAFTRVEVEEGRVAVRSERGPSLLGPGEDWTSREPVVATPAPSARLQPSVVPEPSVRPVPATAPSEIHEQPAASMSSKKPPAEASESEAVTAPVVETPASVLAEQNRLFQAAALAKRSGLPKLALERLQTLMDTYPEAELAHNARVEHFRLLRDLRLRERARASARVYLERYPSGFAAGEAKRVLEGTEAP